jgi:hypothetical protein
VLGAPSYGHAGRSLGLQSFDPVEQQVMGCRLALFDHSVEPLQRLLRFSDPALDFSDPAVGHLLLQKRSQSLEVEDPLDDMTRDRLVKSGNTDRSASTPYAPKQACDDCFWPISTLRDCCAMAPRQKPEDDSPNALTGTTPPDRSFSAKSDVAG